MGIFSNLVSAAVKIAVTPVAIVKDATEVALGNSKPSNTKEILESAGKDLEDAINL
jgi:hypothetical protein